MVTNGSISDLRIDIENTDSQSRPPLLSNSGPTETRKMRLAPRLCHCYPAPIPLSRASLRLRHPVFLVHCPSKLTSSLPDKIKRHVSEGVGRHARHCPAHPISGVVPVMEQGEQTSKKKFCKWPGRFPVYTPKRGTQNKDYLIPLAPYPRTYCNNPHRGQYDIKYILHTF